MFHILLELVLIQITRLRSPAAFCTLSRLEKFIGPPVHFR